MKIGLVRHFKVISPPAKKKLNSAEFNERMSEYDINPVKPNKIKIDSSEWDVCYASTLPRAQTTAKTIYNETIITTPLIVEVPLSAFIKTKTRLPLLTWLFVGRIAWLFSAKSQSENKSQTLARVNEFLELIETSGKENILIVSHGFFMKVFVGELKKRGFIGDLDFSPNNGKLYRFEK